MLGSDTSDEDIVIIRPVWPWAGAALFVLVQAIAWYVVILTLISSPSGAAICGAVILMLMSACVLTMSPRFIRAVRRHFIVDGNGITDSYYTNRITIGWSEMEICELHREGWLHYLDIRLKDPDQYLGRLEAGNRKRVLRDHRFNRMAIVVLGLTHLNLRLAGLWLWRLREFRDWWYWERARKGCDIRISVPYWKRMAVERRVASARRNDVGIA